MSYYDPWNVRLGDYSIDKDFNTFVHQEGRFAFRYLPNKGGKHPYAVYTRNAEGAYFQYEDWLRSLNDALDLIDQRIEEEGSMRSAGLVIHP